MILNYTTVPLSGQAIPRNGGNEDEIRDFAGPDFIEARDGRVWIRVAEGLAEVHPGWLVAREEGELVLYAPGAFRRHVPAFPVS